MKLSELWKKHPEVFGNVDSDRFPLLIKIIDAKDDLSIQVHPTTIMQKSMKMVHLEKQSAGTFSTARKMRRS